jgi:hypothetical protein
VTARACLYIFITNQSDTAYMHLRVVEVCKDREYCCHERMIQQSTSCSTYRINDDPSNRQIEIMLCGWVSMINSVRLDEYAHLTR